MRTWKLKPAGSDWPEAGKVETAEGWPWPASLNEERGRVLWRRVANAQVSAFDETEAAKRMLLALGLEMVPCCELGAEPCDNCAEEAYERHQAAMLECPPATPGPEEIRASDADRGRRDWFGIVPALWPQCAGRVDRTRT